jgi:hypothetical protein
MMDGIEDFCLRKIEEGKTVIKEEKEGVKV